MSIEYFDDVNNNDASKNEEILEKLNDDNCNIFNDEKEFHKSFPKILIL